MKNYVLLFILISLFSINCSNDSINNPEEKPEPSGRVAFQIEKTSIPNSVTSILVTFSRDGYQDIKDSITSPGAMTTDTPTVGLAAGLWEVDVKAFGNNNAVLFFGRSELPIYEDNLTKVNAVLNIPGDVKIILTWGSSQFTGWTDSNLNPILTLTGDSYDNFGILQPKIIYENGNYKMWYMGLTSGSRSVVCYAESQDGLSWTRPVQNPVMTFGNPGSWDATSSIAGAIMKDDSIYRMYYIGWDNQFSNWHIGLATSPDGKIWTKYSEPVLRGTSGWEFQIIPTSIIKNDGLYYLYYSGLNSPDAKIGLAISTDGVNFTKYFGNPLIVATEQWEGSGVYYATVIKDANLFKMVYSGKAGDAFGSAVSDDGKRWIKSSANPFFKCKDTKNTWASGSVAYPFLMKIENQYRLYYSGYGSNSTYNIGLAIKE